jgi:diguanylate cyclase (GGDEF)-like protein
MDIVMPQMSGIDACRAIKANERLRDIPIIMVTGMSADDDLAEAFAAGAMDYVTKPIKVVELLARLRSALALKHELDNRRAHEIELVEMTRKLKEMNQVLENLSTHDPLTGLANRRVMTSALPREWSRSAREAAPLSAIMMDIDHFKEYNDHYGHLQGDECLRRVTQALRSQLKRSSDTLVRLGGEEFAALLPRTNAAGANVVASALHGAVDRLGIAHTTCPIGDHITLSIGVATIVPQRRSNPEELLRKADQALYDAKRQGRNRIVVAHVTAKVAGNSGSMPIIPSPKAQA